MLSETDDDEMYRGTYFPRRFPGESLSLEYYNTYDDRSSKKNIALVAGMYVTRQGADSCLEVVKDLAPRAFVLKAVVYEGCIH